MPTQKKINEMIKEMRQRHSMLLTEREPWMPDWKSLAEYFIPRNATIFDAGKLKGSGHKLEDTELLDDTSVQAMRALAAGMQGRMTSPARPWFRLGTPDPQLQENAEVSTWLSETRDRSLYYLSISNFYDSIHYLKEELATYGTAVMFIEEDIQKVFNFDVIPTGTYCLASSKKGQVDTLFRDLQMTAQQLVTTFGEDKVSSSVKQANNDSNKDKSFDVVHVVMPNPLFSNDRDKAGIYGRPFISVYYEKSLPEDRTDEQPTLSVNGYFEKPFVAPRWNVTADEIYGRSPGWDTWQDVRTLQNLMSSLLTGVHKQVDPPMNAPHSLDDASTDPGDINFMDDPSQGMQPSLRVNIDTSGTGALIQEKRQAIQVGLYNDLFRMFSLLDKNMTATEVDRRTAEQLLQLGPVIERLHSELHEPIIDRIIAIMDRLDLLPPAPEIIQGTPFKVEFISTLAQAQKVVGTNSIEQFMGFLGGTANMDQSVLDVANFDEITEEYADLLNISPALLNSDETRRQIRESRAQIAADQAAGDKQTQAAEGMKTIAEANEASPEAMENMAAQGQI